METHEAHFDPQTLPTSAQKISVVVEAALRNLGYRCDVCRFWHIPKMRRHLVAIAKSEGGDANASI